MPNRVTFTQVNSLVQNNIAANYRKLADYQEQLSSGRRIMRPSDAPIDITNDLQMRSSLSQLGQFDRNINDGLAYLSVLENNLSSMNELYQKSRELAIQGSNDTNTATERSFMLNEVRVIFDQLASLSNSAYKGSFMFSGTETQTPPYEIHSGRESIDGTDDTATNTTDTFLNAGNIGTPIQLWDRNVTDSNTPSGNAAAYDVIPGTVKISGFTEGIDYTMDYVNGTVTFTQPGAAALAQASAGVLDITFDWIRRNEKDLDGEINREIERGLESRINTTASDVFGSKKETTSWDAMIRLMEGLHTNNSTVIRESIGGIGEAFNKALQAQSIAGARTNRFDTTDIRNEDAVVGITRLHSELEDVDFAKVISDFMLQESVYSASLQTGARVIQPTLANFI